MLAEFLRKNAGDDVGRQVELGLTRVTQRRPHKQETERGVALIDSLKKDGVPADAALKYFCLAIYNLNEFLYLD